MYNNWRKNRKYTHITINEDGKPEETECTSYTYHVERMLKGRKILEGYGQNHARYENKIAESLL